MSPRGGDWKGKDWLVGFFLSQTHGVGENVKDGVGEMWSAELSHYVTLYNFQKAVDLSKDDLLGDILQDLNTEVSHSLGVVKYVGGIGWRNSSVIVQNRLLLQFETTNSTAAPPPKPTKNNNSKLVSYHFSWVVSSYYKLCSYVDGAVWGCIWGSKSRHESVLGMHGVRVQGLRCVFPK